MESGSENAQITENFSDALQNRALKIITILLASLNAEPTVIKADVMIRIAFILQLDITDKPSCIRSFNREVPTIPFKFSKRQFRQQSRDCRWLHYLAI